MKAGKFPLAYPTAGFGALLFVLGAMWYAASSQNSAAIYLLLFLLASVFLVSIPNTLTNLAGVTLRVESAKPTFAGDEVFLPVEIMNTSRATRYGIEVVLPDADKTRERVDCIPRESAARLTLRFAAHHRGEHKIEKLDLTSCYPLGFVRASKRFVVQSNLPRLSQASGKFSAANDPLTIRRQLGSARHRARRRFCGGPRLRARRIPTSH